MFRFFRVSENEPILTRIYRFRCEILCDELGYFKKEDYPDGLEIDPYDAYSIQYAALDSQGELAATVRLILKSPIGYPTENHMEIDDNIIKELDREKLGEISRIFIKKEYRTIKSSKYIMRNFIKMIYEDMKLNGIEYTYGALEKSFFRLLRIYKMRYIVIGKLQEYGGLRYPCILYTRDLEADNPELIREWKAKYAV